MFDIVLFTDFLETHSSSRVSPKRMEEGFHEA